MLRRSHRFVGLLLLAPMVLWIATGLLFHVKHRYGEAYEALAVPEASGAPWLAAQVSPARIAGERTVDTTAGISLAVHPGGVVAYYGSRSGVGVAVDASNGRTIPPADEATARAWVTAAVARSPHAARYGAAEACRETRVRSRRTRGEDPGFVITFAGGKAVTVNRLTGEMTQSGALNDWIDFTYRVHYLQWTPWPNANIALVLLASVATLWLAASGASMALGARTRSP